MLKPKALQPFTVIEVGHAQPEAAVEPRTGLARKAIGKLPTMRH
jgi:hypothetical protein